MLMIQIRCQRAVDLRCPRPLVCLQFTLSHHLQFSSFLFQQSFLLRTPLFRLDPLQLLLSFQLIQLFFAFGLQLFLYLLGNLDRLHARHVRLDDRAFRLDGDLRHLEQLVVDLRQVTVQRLLLQLQLKFFQVGRTLPYTTSHNIRC